MFQGPGIAPRYFPGVLASILLCAAVAGGPAAAEPAPDFPAAALRAHMEFLADDLLEGRAAGTPGYGVAAAYVASVFQAAGLEPAGAPTGDERRWFQAYRLLEAQLVPGSARVTLTRDGRTETLAFETEFMAGGDFLRERSEVAAGVTFVGFGVTAPELGHDDYAGVDVRGRIVAMFSGAPASFPADQRAYYSSVRVKLENAVARGAVGVISFYTDEFLARNPWDDIVKAYAFPRMRWVAEDGAVQGTWPEIRGGVLLSPAGLERLLAGSGRTAAELQAEATDGTARAFELPGTVTLARSSTHRRLEDRNVAAVLPGADPALRDEYVVITGHLDHIGTGPEVDGDALYNGYYDNAAGIAVMLETARALARSPERPARSILFLAVGAEEKGLLGSDYFAANPTVPIDALVANVNFDMPLFIFPTADVVAYGAEHSSLAAPTARAAAAAGFEVSPDPIPEEVIFIRSDQYSLVRRGVPAVYLMPGLRSRNPDIDGAAAFRAFLAQRYHKPSDESGLPFDDDTASRFTAMNYHLVRLIANAPERPTWNDGDFFGELFGRPADR
jgi:hypothetical protein